MRKVYNLVNPKRVVVENAPKQDADGRQIISASFQETGGLLCQIQTEKITVEPDTINIIDTEIVMNQRLSGGEYWVDPDGVDYIGPNDYVEFAIVDKNDVLGFFSQYGLEPGVDILELSKFVSHEYIRKGNKANGYHADLVSNMVGTSLVIPGLFKRIYYFAEDLTVDAELIVRYYYFV